MRWHRPQDPFGGESVPADRSEPDPASKAEPEPDGDAGNDQAKSDQRTEEPKDPGQLSSASAPGLWCDTSRYETPAPGAGSNAQPRTEDGGAPHSGIASVSAVDSVVAQNSTRRIFVPHVLARLVYLHLLKNYLPWTRADADLIFGISGPFGAGKSCILAEICHRLVVHVVVLSASLFESRWAGEPAERVKAAYVEAAEYQGKKGIPCALLIDDIDLAVGYHQEYASGTTNTPHVRGAIMELAVHPTLVDGRPTDRVPILVTANDMSCLYGGLVRPRRMRCINWNPSREDVLSIGNHILRGMVSPRQWGWVADQTPTWTVAHYGQLKSVLQETAVERACSGMPAKDRLYAALQNGQMIGLAMPRVTWEILEAAVSDVERSVSAAQTDYTRPQEEETDQ